jgi:hypothetical protein
MTKDKRPAFEQASESLAKMQREQAKMLEADRIEQGLGKGKYRGIAQVEAERHAKEAGED